VKDWTAIEDRPRPGKEPVITPEAKAWLAGIDDVNRHPVIHTSSYKLADAA
jgi:hypothetical protein